MYLTAQSLAAFAWRDQGSKIDMYCKIQGSEGPDSFFCGDNLWTGLAHVSACTAMCDNTTVTTASYDLVALQTTLMGTNAFCKSHVPCMCLKFEDELPGHTCAGCHEPCSHGAVEPGNPDKPCNLQGLFQFQEEHCTVGRGNSCCLLQCPMLQNPLLLFFKHDDDTNRKDCFGLHPSGMH